MRESERAKHHDANWERIVKTISPERRFFALLLVATSLSFVAVLWNALSLRKEVPLLEGNKKIKCYTKSLTKNPTEKKTLVGVSLNCTETKWNKKDCRKKCRMKHKQKKSRTDGKCS